MWAAIWAALFFVLDAICMSVHVSPSLSSLCPFSKTFGDFVILRLKKFCSDRILIHIWKALPHFTVSSEFCTLLSEQCTRLLRSEMLVLWCNIRWQWMSYFTIKERLHNFCWTVAELSTNGNWTIAAHWTSLSVQYCHVPLALKTLSLGSLSESERNRIAKNKQVSPLWWYLWMYY